MNTSNMSNTIHMYAPLRNNRGEPRYPYEAKRRTACGLQITKNIMAISFFGHGYLVINCKKCKRTMKKVYGQ
jgi:hypothetical protein